MTWNDDRRQGSILTCKGDVGHGDRVTREAYSMRFPSLLRRRCEATRSVTVSAPNLSILILLGSGPVGSGRPASTK